MIGNINATFKLYTSLIKPYRNGTIAPPTIAVQSIPLPWSIYFPRPFTANVNMVANIKEFIKPINKRLHMANSPVVKIETTKSNTAKKALNANT